MKKCLSALLALCMAAMLAGCMYETAETTVKADGSGTVKATFGYSERFVEVCDLQDEMKQEGFTRFTAGGKVYYGDTAEETFADPAAFNAIFADSAAEMKARMKASGGELNMGTLTLDKTADGDLTLTLVCDGNTGSADAMARALKQEGKVSDSDLTALRDDLVMRYSFAFPKAVRQTSGGTSGVTITGGKLDIDLTKLSAGTYAFTTAAQETWTIPTPEPTNLPDQGTVYARTQNIDIDGKAVTFKTYAIVDSNGGETNYVKLRDVAYAMNGTAAQFGVDWDGDVLIVPHSAYVPNRSEMSTPFTGDRAYTKAASATKVNGTAVPFSAIYLTDDNHGGYTYYKLRDLGQVLGFNVSWSVERGIYIDSDKPYTAD